MNSLSTHPALHAMAEAKPAGFLVMDADRVLYVGRLGKPSLRELGSYTAYVSLGSPFSLRYADEAWTDHECAVVRPYIPHWITSPNRFIAVVVIEPESLDLAQFPCRHDSSRCCQRRLVLAGRVRSVVDDFCAGASHQELFGAGLEQVLLGRGLRRKPLDPRIERVISYIRNEPQQRRLAEDLAIEVDLSFSRFLHLFKQEMDVPFRRYQAWRRARNVLAPLAGGAPNLTEVALDGGYPDSTHFSHTVRQVYGLRPRDIVTGSRKLELFAPATPTA